MTAEHPASPRIFFLSYTTPPRRERGRFMPRTGSAWIKVPYSGLYGLNETLTRAMSTGQVEKIVLRWARPGEITPQVRAGLMRWPDALRYTSEVTSVDWTR